MSQNKNCKHSSKIWLQCIRVLLSPVFCTVPPSTAPHTSTCKRSLSTFWKLITYWFIILRYWACIHIMIPNRDHSNWARHGINSNKKKKPNKRLPKLRLTHKKNQKTPKQNKEGKNPNPIHQTLKHILSSIHISNYLTIQRQIILVEERSSDQSHRSLQQNQDQKPHITYY